MTAARFLSTLLLAFAVAIALGRLAAIDDGAQAVADDLNDAIYAAQIAAKARP